MNVTLTSCENLIDKYVNKYNGQMNIIEEGCLGLGKILLHSAIGKCTIIIEEYYISAWASGHKVRQYKKMPKKYEKYM